MNILDSVWACKIKCSPNRPLQKSKARFCVRAFQQIEGIDYFELYSPVVSWLTVCLLFTIALRLNIQSIQVNYTAVFPQAPLTDDVFVEMLRGYRDKNEVYKLKRNLNSLNRSPTIFLNI